MKDIPKGSYCYTPVGWDGDTYRVKSCPYWQPTKHGTVRCNFLKGESLYPDNKSWKMAVEHFGSEEAVDEACNLLLLWDQVKECSENVD